jgi:hypothetical protein
VVEISCHLWFRERHYLAMFCVRITGKTRSFYVPIFLCIKLFVIHGKVKSRHFVARPLIKL